MAVTLWLVIWLTGAWFGIEIPAFDATAAVAYLTPLLTLYGARRYTDKKTEEKKGKEES